MNAELKEYEALSSLLHKKAHPADIFGKLPENKPVYFLTKRIEHKRAVMQNIKNAHPKSYTDGASFYFDICARWALHMAKTGTYEVKKKNDYGLTLRFSVRKYQGESYFFLKNLKEMQLRMRYLSPWHFESLIRRDTVRVLRYGKELATGQVMRSGTHIEEEFFHLPAIDADKIGFLKAETFNARDCIEIQTFRYLIPEDYAQAVIQSESLKPRPKNNPAKKEVFILE